MDTKLELTYNKDKDLFNTIVDNLYLSDRKYRIINFPTTWREKIMLIDSSCGRGKTHYCLSKDGLVKDINERFWRDNLDGDLAREYRTENGFRDYYHLSDILFLVSRKAIKDQQIADGMAIPFTVGDLLEPQGNKPMIDTAHHFGMLVKENAIKRHPRILIIDEFHSIVSETSFADDLLPTIEYFKNHNEIIRLAMTATPEIIQSFVDLDMIKINDDLPPKYRVGNIKIFINKQGESILSHLDINENHKVLYYTTSAKDCARLAHKYGGEFMISDYSEHTDLVEEMNERGTKDYITTTRKFPANLICLNSAMREGFNISDETVKDIVIEAVDLTTIHQVLGRMRQNINNVYIVANFKYKTFLDKATNFKKINGKYTPDADFVKLCKGDEIQMIKRAGAQEENADLPKLVYEAEGKYCLNEYALGYLRYMYECYLALAQDNYTSTIGGKTIMSRDMYFNSLAKYSDNPIEMIKDEVALNNVPEEYLNRKLTTADKDELIQKLNWRTKKRELMKWSSVKTKLESLGYKITDGRTNTERYSIIEVTKQGAPYISVPPKMSPNIPYATAKEMVRAQLKSASRSFLPSGPYDNFDDYMADMRPYGKYLGKGNTCRRNLLISASGKVRVADKKELSRILTCLQIPHTDIDLLLAHLVEDWLLEVDIRDGFLYCYDFSLGDWEEEATNRKEKKYNSLFGG